MLLAARFAIYDLKGPARDELALPPKTIFEAAERGDASWIQNLVERTVEFDIDQRVRPACGSRRGDARGTLQRVACLH